MRSTSAFPVLIIEGVDGAGKTTLAQGLTDYTNADYVHFNALPRVTRSLGRIYVEAMLPALQGHHPVILDRSWLSEVPYGTVFRGGKDRLGDVQRRMLERVAMRSQALVISCDPGWETVSSNYLNRGNKLEMAKRLDQLQRVYECYRTEQTGLNVFKYDYTKQSLHDVIKRLYGEKDPCHLTEARTAGNMKGRVLLVGESFAQHKEHDPFYQLPFVSFDKASSSHWLTQQLMDADIDEDQLLWINADDPGFVKFIQYRAHQCGPIKAIALGNLAAERLAAMGVTYKPFQHPQYWKRFQHGKPYPLIDAIKEAL